MNRRHPSRRMTGKHFAQIPVEVLTSEAFITLVAYAVRLLLAIAAQYRGNNNGDLAMTRAIARQYGIYSQGQLVLGLATLLEHGLIEKTRQGGRKPMGPCLYAITWQPIDDLKGKIESGPTTTASNAWAKWAAAAQGAVSKINHRVRRRTALGPPRDQTAPISGPPRDQREVNIGSADGPPSRVSPEGHATVGDGTGVHQSGHVIAAGRGRT
jgi:hypothetical protein